MTNNFPRGAVVVGVDGSTHSDQALVAAVELARLEHRPLHVLHTFDGPPRVYARHGLPLDFDELVSSIKHEAQHVIDTARERVTQTAPEVDLTVELSTVDAREALQNASATAAVVVVGSRGRGRMSSLILGSVSLWVSQHAHCPVLVVRPSHGEHPSRIIVGTDATEVSADALDFAFAQASLRSLPLTVAHCFDDTFAGGYGLTGVPDEDLEGLPDERLAIGRVGGWTAREVRRRAGRLRARSRPGGGVPHPCIRAGHPAGRGLAAPLDYRRAALRRRQPRGRGTRLLLRGRRPGPTIRVQLISVPVAHAHFL